MVKSQSGAKLSRLESQHYHVLFCRQVVLLNPHFLVCKMRVRIAPATRGCGNMINTLKVFRVVPST